MELIEQIARIIRLQTNPRDDEAFSSREVAAEILASLAASTGEGLELKLVEPDADDCFPNCPPNSGDMTNPARCSLCHRVNQLDADQSVLTEAKAIIAAQKAQLEASQQELKDVLSVFKTLEAALASKEGKE